MDHSEAALFRGCENGRCSHDLARAVGVAELWGGDGPFTAVGVVNLDTHRVTRFADDEPPPDQQRWAV